LAAAAGDARLVLDKAQHFAFCAAVAAAALLLAARSQRLQRRRYWVAAAATAAAGLLKEVGDAFKVRDCALLLRRDSSSCSLPMQLLSRTQLRTARLGCGPSMWQDMRPPLAHAAHIAELQRRQLVGLRVC